MPRKFDKLAGGGSLDAAIERAKASFLAARTPYARRKAMRRLQDLGVAPTGKAK
jgi:hypothetical protein